MARYIYQHSSWPNFYWDQQVISPLLARLRFSQGKLLGGMETLGFQVQLEASLQTQTLNVIKSSEIEGEVLDAQQVRSSVARQLGMDISGLIPSDRHVDGVVEMMLDATQNFHEPLSQDRLFGWHSALFPGGRSGMQKIVVGGWRDNAPTDPMQVVSGPMHRQVVHFEAPGSEVLEKEMKAFIDWFNLSSSMDDVIKAAVAHLWFVTLHPFDDGNGRIARAIADLQLARADGTSHRFYSMSSQIRFERNAYYDVLEKTQKDDLDITAWLEWFLTCLERGIISSKETFERVLAKARFWDKHAGSALNGRQVMMLNKLWDGFEGKLNTSKWAKIAKCSQDTALRDITDLLQRGILVKEAEGGRSTSYVIA